MKKPFGQAMPKFFKKYNQIKKYTVIKLFMIFYLSFDNTQLHNELNYTVNKIDVQ